MIEIEKPQIECIEAPGDASYGKYVIEPLDRKSTRLNSSHSRLSRMPAREDIDMPIEEHLIVELYSK